MEGTPLRTFFSTTIDEVPEVIKASGGRLYGLFVSNPNAAGAFIQLFDLATVAEVTIGTTVPKQSFAVPVGVDATNVGVLNVTFPDGMDFSKGILVAGTTAPTGATGPTADLVVNAYFK